MFEEVRAGVDGWEIPLSPDGVAEALAVLDRVAAKVTAAVGALDAGGEWAADGDVSLTAWLRNHGGLSRSSAHRMSCTARRLRVLPVTEAAWVEGGLSGGQVQAVLANVTDATVEQFAGQEASVVPTLVPLSVSDTATVMRRWRVMAEAVLPDGALAEEPECVVHHSCTLGGRWELAGSFDAESGAVVDTTIRLAMSDDAEGERSRSLAERRADGLADVCRFFLDHQRHRPAGRHRPHLNVMIDLADLEAGRPARLVDGPLLSQASTRRLVCDSAVHRVLTEGRSTVLDYGTATRTPPANLFNALVLRDEHCRHPGCDRPAGWCEAHHVIPWEHGGTTSLDNLVLKCSRHHHLGHKPGWHDKLKPDGTYQITDPTGRTWTSHPPGTLTNTAA